MRTREEKERESELRRVRKKEIELRVAFFCLAVRRVIKRGQFRRRFVLVFSVLSKRGKQREVWSVLEHLHAGLQLEGWLCMYVFERIVQRYRFSFSCLFLNRSLIQSESQA